jgi:S-formylglutathione hydrolase FrmB
MRVPGFRGTLLVGVLALLTLVAVLPAGAAPLTPQRTGLTEVGRTTLSPRLVELTMRTPALAQDTKVRVLLPSDYDDTRRRYPVLFLLNGGAGSWLDWTVSGEAERLTAGLPLIVVMPDGGTGGNYTDWYGDDGSGQRPLWESYHIDQLLPWVDRHFRTLADRSQRAVAGLSMGGNGALHYAARHPDLFVAAASFSGAVDVFNPFIMPITETTGFFDGALPGAVFGPRLAEEVRWRGSNPVDLAANLRDTWVSLAFGDGSPGGPGGEQGYDIVERAVHDSNVALHDKLVQAGIPHVYDAYGPGSHTWPYWIRELGDTLPALMAVFAEQRTAPSTVTHAAVEPSYSVHGWDVRITRPAMEWSELSRASATGFTLRGSGAAVVRTPARWRPGIRLVVTTTPESGATTRTTVTAGPDGRITVPVPLGPGNPFQQYTAPALATGTTIFSTHVVITRA